MGVHARRAAGVLVAAAVVGLAGCTGSSGQQGGPSTGATSPTAGATSSAASTGPDATFPPLASYAYVALPTDLAGFADGARSTGEVDAADGRGVARAAGGPVVASVLVTHYTPSATATVEKLPVAGILESVAGAAKSFTGANATVTKRVVAGREVRLVQGSTAAEVVAYEKGGTLVQVMGPTSAAVLEVADAYLAAR